MAEVLVSDVFRLYEQHGSTNYLGDKISKTDHSIQCAMLAEKEGQPVEVVLAAFLHDIGHLVGADRGLEEITTGDLHLGFRDHDVVGGQYLRNIGFPDKVCDLVQDLSSASRMTLEHQGGRMSDEEAIAFENNPLFDVIIRMRTWDEAGKDVNVKNESLNKYRKLCLDYLTSIR